MLSAPETQGIRATQLRNRSPSPECPRSRPWLGIGSPWRGGAFGVSIGTLALLGLGLTAGCKEVRPAAAQEGPAEEGIPVRLVQVERRAVARPLAGSGLLRRKREYDLAFKIGGVVAQVAVDAG